MSVAEPLLIPDSESEQVELLRQMMETGEAQLVGPKGQQRRIPEDVYQLFLRVLEHLKRGQGVSIVPYNQQLTTQAAADLLGVSRQYFVRLLEDGKVPFHKVGTHRRVLLKDLLAFKERRDRSRRKAITDMAREASDAGVYDKIPDPDG